MKARTVIASTISSAVLFLVAPAAVLADAHEAVMTASTHAGLAAKAGDLHGVDMHLHHVLNCLVGPDGEGFDKSEANPCAQSGPAIPQAANADMMHKLEMVADGVRKGLASDDLATAKEAAMHAQEMLKE
jgi:hypothetical protein